MGVVLSDGPSPIWGHHPPGAIIQRWVLVLPLGSVIPAVVELPKFS